MYEKKNKKYITYIIIYGLVQYSIYYLPIPIIYRIVFISLIGLLFYYLAVKK